MNRSGLRVASSYSRVIARMLSLQERDLSRLLEGTDLPTSILLPGDETLIDGEDQLQILANGHRLMEGPGFGLAMGMELGPASHGPVGYLSLASPDLLSALTAYAEFMPARLPIIEIRVALTPLWLECNYEVLLPAPGYILRGMAESFAVAMQALVEEILRREVSEAQIMFQHEPPDYAGLYVTALHGSTSFGNDRICYRVPADLAHCKNTNGDSDAFRATRDLCNRLLERHSYADQTTAARVRTLLLTRPQVAVTEEEVARAMFVSRRTLARRLQEEGTGYRKIRDGVLKELACQFLMQTDRSVESVSASLGYHDSAAFRKAFKRWTGKTPMNYLLDAEGTTLR